MRRLRRLLLGMGIGMLLVFSLMSLTGYIFARWLFSQPPLRDYHQPVLAALKRYGRNSPEYQQSKIIFLQQVRAARLRVNAPQGDE